jgi:hypothetical protein
MGTAAEYETRWPFLFGCDGRRFTPAAVFVSMPARSLSANVHGGAAEIVAVSVIYRSNRHTARTATIAISISIIVVGA